MSLATSSLASIAAALQLPVDSPDWVKIRQALTIAEHHYGDHAHWTGMPLLAHAIGVLQVLAPFRPDVDAVCACLLQHVLQARSISLNELEEEFGADVRGLISSIHLLSHVSMRSRRRSIEDMRLMLLSVSDDVRVLLVILCERTYVLEHVSGLPSRDGRRICRDVLQLFAPVAARLGIHSLKQRLESLAFPVVYPLDADMIADQLAGILHRHGQFLSQAASSLTSALQQQGIMAAVHGREKQPYSIFAKLRSKSVSSIESLPDLFAFRVIVENEDDCYRALGLLHRMGHPLPSRFKDYIAFPKPNGYRSLHTTVSLLPGVPDGVFVEVQVRTHAMHREAEYGIAAHWSYKEGGSARNMLQRVHLQQMLTTQQSTESARGTSHLVDHIFVLTPKGDIVELPEGATALDFAFQVHTDLGLGFRVARVNGNVVPLDYALENGDVVEIQSTKKPSPSPEWLQLLKMASSRSRLRRYLHSIDRAVYIQRGKDRVNAELRERQLPVLDGDLSLLRRYDGQNINIDAREDHLMKIGQGSDRASSLFRHLDLLHSAPSVTRETPKRFVRGADIRDAFIELEGGVPMPMRYAKCCNPLASYPENIIGSINRSGQVMVHRDRCRMVRNSNPERRVGVRWRKI